MFPPPSCWKAAPMLPTTLRERTVMPRTTPRFRTIRAPSMLNAVVTHWGSMVACFCASCCMHVSLVNTVRVPVLDDPQDAGGSHDGRDRPGVGDVAGERSVQGGAEGHLAHDHVPFIRFGAAVHPLQAPRQEQMLAAGDEPAPPRPAQRRPPCRDEPGFLSQLALCPGQRVLTRLQCARRHLPGSGAPLVAPLA